ncbi:MAG: fibronectin-binding autotransporter adhesin [Verrucomicrobiota bacterium]
MVLGGGIAKAQRPIGIDVSDYQSSSLNWNTIKSYGVSFAWAKATEGTGFTGTTFAGNENNGKAAGLYMGAYHYAHPESDTASSEASHFWAVAGPYIQADGLTLMPMLDIEGSANNGHVGAASLSDWINQWCTDVIQDAANAGVAIKPCIYVSSSHAVSWFDGTVTQWNNDIADWPYAHATAASQAQGASGPPAGESPWSTWQFWQYDDQNVAQAYTTGDGDIFNGTLQTLTNTMIAIANTNAAKSAIYYWDPQGTSGANPYTGSMSETWENAKWSYLNFGMGAPTNWVEGKAACFGIHTGIGTPAYTVTMNANHVVAGFFDGHFNGSAPFSCDVTIQGSGTIQLASGPQALDSINSTDGSLGLLRINVTISGDGQLFPEGTGQSYLRGTNTYTGGTELGFSTVPFSGTVNFNNGSAFGSGTITLWTHGNGGALVLEGSSAVTVPNDVAVASATTNNIVGNTAGLTFSGNWSLGANLLTLGAGATAGKQTIISGVVSGTAGLTVYNSGTVVLSGINTYTGTTTINSPAVFTIGGAGQLNNGSYANNIVNNGTFNYNSTASQGLSGTISGTGPLKQSNAGTLILTHANTYTGGTTVSSGGTLCITADSALGAAAGALTLNGGCLKNNNSAPAVTASRTITLGASSGYLDAGWAPSNPLTIGAKLTGTGRLHINLDGSPVVLTNTANDYTGNTIIGTNGPGYYSLGTQAWLKLGASGVIPSGSGKGNVFIYQAYNGLLDLAGFSQTINGLSGDGIVNNSVGNGALSVGSNNQTSTFSGIIENTGGSLALTKLGTGTLTLAGANTYTGSTTVSAGTLALGNGGSIGVSAVTVASGAKLANSTTNPASIGGSATLSSGALASFTAVGGTSSALGQISVGGNLTLNANTLTISVSGSALAIGTYRLLDCAGTLTGSANPTPTITGTAFPPGYTASIATVTGSAGHVDLLVRATSAFSNLTASPQVLYGTSSLALGGTVSATGPLYPAAGETIGVTINGNTQTTTINDATGDFSITYNPSAIPASGSPYPINYSYSGDASLTPAGNAGTTLTVNQLPVILTGTRPYDGTTSADSSILSVSNLVGSDVVTVASGSGTLASANAGSEPISSFGTLALGGASAANYTLAGASGSVTITVPAFSITSEYTDDTGTNFVITWQSVPGATYRVLSSTDVSLGLNFWTDLTGPITATDTSMSATNPITSSANFFNVKTP